MKVRTRGGLAILLALTAVNASYLVAFDSPTIFYYANVIGHVVLGALLSAALALSLVGWLTRERPRLEDAPGLSAVTAAVPPSELTIRLPRRLYAPAALVMVVTGAWLVRVGTASTHLLLLRTHEVACLIFVLAFVLLVRSTQTNAKRARTLAILAAAALIFPA